MRSERTLILKSAAWGSDGWNHLNGANIREAIVRLGAGLANFQETRLDNGPFPVGPARRMGNYFNSLPNGTIIENATVPIFIIESFEWITDEAQIPSETLAGIANPEMKYLTYAQPDTTLTGTAGGATALLREAEYDHEAQRRLKALPEPTALSHALKYAATYLYSVPPEKDCGLHWDNNEFSPMPSGIHVVESHRRDRRDCMVVAQLRVSAGVTHCNQIDPTSDPTCILDSNVIVSSSREVLPDPLTDIVLAMIPEVHTVVASLRMSDAEQHKGSLARVMQESLVQSYQGAWCALTDFVSPSLPSDQEPHTRVWEPEQFLQAQVSGLRLFLWFAASMLLVVSGVLLMVLDHLADGRTVNNPAMAAIMLDTSEVIAADDTGLCSAMNIDKGHEGTNMGLRLEVSSRSDTGDYYHPKLVPETSVL